MLLKFILLSILFINQIHSAQLRQLKQFYDAINYYKVWSEFLVCPDAQKFKNERKKKWFTTSSIYEVQRNDNFFGEMILYLPKFRNLDIYFEINGDRYPNYKGEDIDNFVVRLTNKATGVVLEKDLHSNDEETSLGIFVKNQLIDQQLMKYDLRAIPKADNQSAMKNYIKQVNRQLCSSNLCNIL